MMNMENHSIKQVKIGPKFFENELRVYRDWGLAFWRENLQNSVDAGSTRIDISITPLNDDISQCIIADNGCGMTREQLETVYFILGETTKGEGDIGGFGKARILTCFSQAKYTLETGKLIAVGCGADYEIKDTTDNYKGVRLTVDVHTQGINILEKLESYLSKCFLDCDVYVNGAKWKEWTYRNRLARELSFGNVYTNKSQIPELLVRVNGTLMFRSYTTAPAQVILEIHSDHSRNVLQASRDGLVYPYQGELESFVSELNINKRSALKARRNKSAAYRGSGTFTSKRKEKVKNIFTGESEAEVSTENTVQTGTFAKPVVKSGYSVEHTEYAGLDLFDVIIEDETYNSDVRKVIDQYIPHNWDLDETVRYNQNGSYRRGLSRLKLLLCWKAACEKVIEILQDEYNRVSDQINWGVGWYFSDDSGACCKTFSNVSYLLLNPCDKYGKMAYSISSNDDLCKLISLAAHEVAHIANDDHDEPFAGILTKLHEITMVRKQEIINYMKSAKDSVALTLND